MRITQQTKRLTISIAAALSVVSFGYLWLGTRAEVVTADEIHYSFHEDSDKVVFNWRGAEDTIYYGPTASYGQQATATNSTITPVDMPGPFREVTLNGLQPGTTYHYKIGATGDDRTFKTAPTGDFTWVDIGDSASSLCNSWMPMQHQLIAVQAPDFVTHGGDISEANKCGAAAVHAYYMDQEVWSRSVAFQPVWGNHEYGNPTTEAPPGTPRDTLANYKGRSYITNAQTVPNDTATKTGHPGCGAEIGSPTNTCRGEDWGWFKAGRVLFIAYPEPWTNAWTDWQTKVDPLMAQAQADTNVDFIVTYGHRPAYASGGTGSTTALQPILNALATKYSPRADNVGGKYILNIGHHAHGIEAFAPINGLTHLVNAAGGQGLTNFSDPPEQNSVYRLRHLGILSSKYNATNRSLTVRLVCGAEFSTLKDSCTYGNTLYTTTFTRNTDPTPPPVPTVHEWITNQSVETGMTGWGGKYGGSPYVTVSRSTTHGAHTGSAAIRVAATTGASSLSSGFNDSPRWVTNTRAGTAYSSSVWVKPGHIGQKITLKVREWRGSTLVTDRAASVTAATTGWQRITVDLTAAQNGNQLAFAVYASGMKAGHSFLADDMSLTTPE